VPRPSLPLYLRERPGTPLYRRMGGPQGQSGRVRKISTAPGLDPRTVQPVASRYTDSAIPVRPTLGRLKIYDGDELLLDLRNDDVALSGELRSNIKIFF
jgi:hypothetical protein